MNTITNKAVQKLTHRHRAIMEYMIANPDEPQNEIAIKFGVTPQWLSTLIHSELFQMELSYLQEITFGEVIVSVKDRLNNLAHTSLKRLQEKLELNVVAPGDLVDISELALKNLGFGPKPAGPSGPAGPVFQQINNNFGSAPIDAQLLATARERMFAVKPALEHIPDVQRDGNSNNDTGTQAGQPQAIAIEGSVGGGQSGTNPTSVAPVGP